MRKNTLSFLSLDKAFLGFMVLGALVFFGVTVFFVSNRVENMQERLVRSVVEIRGDHIAVDIINHLENHWSDLKGLATVLPFSDRVTFRNFLTREVADGEHMFWAAYVDVQGDVVLASRQQREGETVADEDWFIQGQTGPLVAYSKDEGGRETLVMSLPISSTGAVRAGVLSFHFNIEWFEKRLGEIASSLAVDVLVVDPRGEAILHSFDVGQEDMRRQSVQNALAGLRVTSVEVWPSLGSRYTISIPNLPASELPALGWRLVVLTPNDQFLVETNELRVALSEILSAVALILLLMSVAFIRIFLVPVHELIVNANDIADGGDVLPAENHRTTELSLLSSAIARLQGRMLRAEDRVAELEAQLQEKVNGDRS